MQRSEARSSSLLHYAVQGDKNEDASNEATNTKRQSRVRGTLGQRHSQKPQKELLATPVVGQHKGLAQHGGAWQ